MTTFLLAFLAGAAGSAVLFYLAYRQGKKAGRKEQTLMSSPQEPQRSDVGVWDPRCLLCYPWGPPLDLAPSEMSLIEMITAMFDHRMVSHALPVTLWECGSADSPGSPVGSVAMVANGDTMTFILEDGRAWMRLTKLLGGD